jgi:hypothetical protein
MIQVLSLCSVVSTSVYFGALQGLCGFMVKIQASHPDVVIGTCNNFQVHIITSDGSTSVTESLSFDVRGSVGWILALSLVAIAYQILAILQLFLNLQVLNTKKVLCKTVWTIFSLMVCA